MLVFSSAQTTTDNTMLTEFFDSVAPTAETVPCHMDDSFDDGYVPDMALADWFSRPVKIKTYDWVENTSIFSEFNPWSLYFNHPEIYPKLKGFSRMQATLHIKLTINASPYQYGMGLLSYLPLAKSMDDSVDPTPFSGGRTDSTLVSGSAQGSRYGSLIVRTCRPHAEFYPQFSKGCEMVLPFCYYKNWINLDTLLVELDHMGSLSVYTPEVLRTSGVATVNPVSISIFAWCEMHKVSGPSYSLQSGDEYKDRPVSTTMSAMSVLARSVARVPMLGPYAMATSSVLSSMGTAARWFGFSNPPVISDVHAYRPNYMASYSSPEVCVQHEKLTLDPKNELTVDSRTVGLDGTDHMSISHITNRDISFTIANWPATAAATTPLFLSHVSPMIYAYRNYNGATTGLACRSIQMSPSCQVASLFDLWHGPITYRFKALASQFHRGRLLVSYDPDGFDNSYTAQAYTGPRTISKVWDITENPTFEFEVPWMAPSGFLKTGGMSNFNGITHNSVYYPNLVLPGVWKYQDGNYNGSIVVSVLNALTSGSTTAGVSIIVSINAGGVEYAAPREIDLPVSTLTLQSGDDQLATAPDEVQSATVPAYAPPAKHLIYTGEIVRSLRQLMHRTNLYTRTVTYSTSQTPNTLYSSDIPAINFSGTIRSYSSSFITPMLPLMTGNLVPVGTTATQASGIMIKKNSTSGGTNIVNGMHLDIPTVTAYLTGSFVGWRGSHVYHARKYNSSNDTDGNRGVVTDLSISRLYKSISSFFQPTAQLNLRTPFVWRSFNAAVISQTANSLGACQYNNALRATNNYVVKGNAGMAVTNPTHVDVVDAVVPFYSNFRMMPANPVTNFASFYDWNSMPWNIHNKNVENVGVPSVAVNTTVEFMNDMNDTTSNLNRHPTLDIYHKAGVDFTAFWYLNPPALHLYVARQDSWPPLWL